MPWTWSSSLLSLLSRSSPDAPSLVFRTLCSCFGPLKFLLVSIPGEDDETFGGSKTFPRGGHSFFLRMVRQGSPYRVPDPGCTRMLNPQHGLAGDAGNSNAILA